MIKKNYGSKEITSQKNYRRLLLFFFFSDYFFFGSILEKVLESKQSIGYFFA